MIHIKNPDAVALAHMARGIPKTMTAEALIQRHKAGIVSGKIRAESARAKYAQLSEKRQQHRGVESETFSASFTMKKKPMTVQEAGKRGGILRAEKIGKAECVRIARIASEAAKIARARKKVAA